jgi:hypothetical protein
LVRKHGRGALPWRSIAPLAISDCDSAEADALAVNLIDHQWS